MAASAVDPAFASAGKKAGLEIWRIEKLKPIMLDASKHGTFHSGDSYICLQTKAKSAGFEWNIHFWLGKETSTDEAGVAAYKTVELDDSLGGAPVQFREVEGYESNQFLALFPKGVKYLPGGVESGFKHVDKDKFDKRLLHVKGKRQIRVAQVAASADSLNEGDVFILDLGRKIFQWNGKEASRPERSKGIEVSKRIRDEERGGNAEIVVIESGVDDDSAFFGELGGKKRIKSADEGGDDAAFERSKQADVKLYRVSDASGSVQVTEVASPPLSKDHLDTNDCFILDQGGAAIFAWIGKKATKQERASAMKFATDFIAQKKYAPHTQVTKVNEGGETPLFKANFATWPEAMAGTTPQGSNRSNIARIDPNKNKVDIKGMHSQAAREKEALVDDASGKLQIWRIENFDKVPVPQDQYGQFYSGDSYILFYTYLKNSKECYIIYYWQGLKSTTDEKGASAILATKLDDEYGGAPVQVRVVQNKEPEHFLRLFKGKMIVHEGGKGSGFKNANQADNYDTDGTRLFQVRGSNEFNTRAIQVAERAASLNTNDTFVLETKKATFAWFGKGATGDEREIAKIVAKQLTSGKEIVNVMEGQENADFWAALGGKGEYASNPRLADATARPPRLFQCSNAKGYFYVEEIFDFDQTDLVEDDVMLLDAYDEVYLWLGQGCNDTEKASAVKTAQEYIATDPSGRDTDTPILVVKQGFEPPTFTAYFGAWDPEKWANGLSYEQLKAQIGQATTSGAALLKSVDKSGPVTKFYTFAQLTTHPLPDDVDKGERERWLVESEFKDRFKMSRDEFVKLPAWKKTDLKKKIGLF